MGGRLTLALLAASALVPARASALRAQARPPRTLVVPPLLAIALSDLSFGTVLPGVPVSVSVNDVHGSGQFELQGPADASVRLEFTLPPALTSEHGAQLTVRFGAGDGLVSASRDHLLHARLFDPHGPVITTLGADGHLFVRLGGTALPDRPQEAGSYHATISLTVFDLGS